MKLPNWKKNWDKLPSDKRFEIAIGIWTLFIMVFFGILLTIEQGVL